MIHEGAAKKRDGGKIDVNACNDVAGKILENVSHLDKEKEGTDPVYNVLDVDAVVKYFTEKSPIQYPKQDRIIDIGAK
ncbi:hypothetical protein [Xenorhabdus koppenhoeferi]|uniref:5'-nucleotidase n=1 Tax=Xenorhabdus koppenhoeferi TaxID=351659 RepID=A0A1I7FQN2_9GAMM|nr:hypothetical protein [Xenorhabdus koppenhoeferi]SFU38336.1 5'-nucleotidase [Xenorhabdus koppenhoeferi]